MKKFFINTFDNMWKLVFFHDFKKSRAKYGTITACVILFLVCVLRGVFKMLIWKESFWSGFFYAFILFLAGVCILLPLFLLSKRFPKIASIIATIILILILIFFAAIIIFILYCLFFHN